MARFLSREWFDELQVPGDDEGRPGGAGLAPAGTMPAGTMPAGPGDLVVDVVVRGAPGGEVRYQLVVDGGRPMILSHGADFRAAQVKLSGDYATMATIASGKASALEVLSGGDVRLSGDIALLSSGQLALGALDLLPPSVRATTTF